MDPISAIKTGFHAIAARVATIEQHVAAAFQHPHCAPPVADALAEIRAALADVHQELAEQRRPCPCEGSTELAPPPPPAVAVVPAVNNAPQENQAGVAYDTATPEQLAEFRAWQEAKANGAA